LQGDLQNQPQQNAQNAETQETKGFFEFFEFFRGKSRVLQVALDFPMTPAELSERLWRFAAREKQILPLLRECEELSNIIARSLLTAKSRPQVQQVARAREGSI
jgi:molybdopterin-guanine dinucleotide biosynthesis protein A